MHEGSIQMMKLNFEVYTTMVFNIKKIKVDVEILINEIKKQQQRYSFKSKT